MVYFSKIQGVAFEKIAILAILRCFWPCNIPPRGPTRVFPKNLFWYLFHSYHVWSVCKKFFKSKAWFLRKVLFWLFLTLQHPQGANQSFPQKSVPLLSSRISCLKFMQNFKEIQGVVIEKSAVKNSDGLTDGREWITRTILLLSEDQKNQGETAKWHHFLTNDA